MFQRKIVVHLKIQFEFSVCRQVVSHIEMQTAHQIAFLGINFDGSKHSISSLNVEDTTTTPAAVA